MWELHAVSCTLQHRLDVNSQTWQRYAVLQFTLVRPGKTESRIFEMDFIQIWFFSTMYSVLDLNRFEGDIHRRWQ